MRVEPARPGTAGFGEEGHAVKHGPGQQAGAGSGSEAAPNNPSDRSVILARMVIAAQALERDCRLLGLADVAGELRRVECRLRREYGVAAGAPAGGGNGEA